MCEVLFLLRAVLNILVRNASPRGPMCFRCLIFNLSGPCELLYVACLTVFVNCLVKQYAMCVAVVAILLLNVMDVFSVCGGALLDRPCMVFQRVCVVPVIPMSV